MRESEEVLVFPRAIFEEVGSFQGLNLNYASYLEKIFSQGVCYFHPRVRAEQDFKLKQIIPYVLLTWKGKVLRYIRGKKSRETRLVEKASVGVGGHINPIDDSLFHDTNRIMQDLYDSAVQREVAEEVLIESSYVSRIVGILNDDANEVGQVHFGIVHVLELNEPKVKKKDKNITKLEFLDPHTILRDEFEKLESWSQICLQRINKLLPIAS